MANEYIERRMAYSLAKKVCEAVDSNPRVLLPQIILDLIDDVPTADVQPVRHGRWLYDEGDFDCSECDGIVERRVYNYCPWCGAKMDGDK